MIDTLISILINNKSLLLQGLGVTILLAIVGTFVGGIIGILVAIYRVIPIEKQENKLIRFLYHIGYKVLTIYIEVFRSTPLMVQAMLFYYSANAILGTRLDPLSFALVLLSINTGAYMAEIVRGGIISIDNGQYEAAHSVGLTHWQAMKGIIIPQALRTIMPAIGNEFIINMKDSVAFSVISVSELFFTGSSIAGASFKHVETFLLIAIFYLVLTLCTSHILARVEKRMDGDANYELYDDVEAKCV